MKAYVGQGNNTMDLISALKQRIFDLIDSVKPPSRYKVLVVDAKVKQIIELVVDNSELLNRQVANVLMLDETRPMESYLDAVYLVEENSFSFGCIEADFSMNRYSGAHIFLLPRWKSSDSEKTKFQQSCSDRKMVLRHLSVLPFAFKAIEARLFTLDSPNANLLLYNPSFQSGILSLIDMTGIQLASVCKALRIEPYIRYSIGSPESRASKLPESVANALSKHLPSANEGQLASKRSTLIVLDRSIDMGAPLRHSALFQALSQDLTNGKGAPPAPASEVPEALQGKTLGIKFEKFDGGYPSEKDKLWCQLRHKHVVAATQELTKTLKELRAANPNFEEASSDVSVSDVRNMLAALPEFMRARESVGLNLDLAHQCFEALEQPQFQQLLEFEQMLALGVDEKGEISTQSRLADMLVSILAQSAFDSTTKVRALALYVLQRCGIKNSDYGRMQKHARLRDSDIETIKNMNFLGISTVDDGYNVVANPQISSPLIRELPQQPFRFHRVQPGLQTIIQEVLSGKLPESKFPYAGDTPDAVQEALTTATSLRSHRQKATWAQNVNESISHSTENNDSSFMSQQKTLVLFMVGGFTACEAAAVYEIAKASNISIYLGGHDFVTPHKFMEFVNHLNTNAEELNLAEEQPLPQVPPFLLQPPAQKPLKSTTRVTTQEHGSKNTQAQSQTLPTQKPVSQPTASLPNIQKVQGNGKQPHTPASYQSSMQQPPLEQLSLQKTHTKNPKPNKPQKQPTEQSLYAAPQSQHTEKTKPQSTQQMPTSGYTEGGIMYLGTPPPTKEKKDMKKRLKGALNVLKR